MTKTIFLPLQVIYYMADMESGQGKYSITIQIEQIKKKYGHWKEAKIFLKVYAK